MAFFLAPMALSSTGTQAPMPLPMIMKRAMRLPMAPVALRACRMPTEAEQLCSTAVTAMPMPMATTGFSTTVRIRRKDSLSCRGSMAADMVFIPLMRTLRASRMTPTFFLAVVLPVM